VQTDEPRVKPNRDERLDGLRGYCAVAVVFWHTIISAPGVLDDLTVRGIQGQTTLHGTATKLLTVLVNGDLAVNVFFVMSGIVLFRSLGSLEAKTGSVVGTSWRFLLRRVLRIWPVMAAAVIGTFVLLAFLVPIWPGVVAPSPAQVIENLLLRDYPVVGPTWTLAVEMIAAPGVLLCWICVRRFGLAGLIACGLHVAAAWRWQRLLFRSFMLVWAAPLFLAGVAVEFGVLAPIMGSRLRGWAGGLALGVLLADLLFVPQGCFWYYLGGMIVTLPVLLAWVKTSRGGPVDRFLEAPLSRFLGRISFSFYLWNVPFASLTQFAMLRWRAEHPLAVGLAAGAATVLLTLPVAYLSERWLERGSIWVGRVLTPVPGQQPVRSRTIRRAAA
jgi:peptidoglycan/LPS O-acetylase OafA/YrhL